MAVSSAPPVISATSSSGSSSGSVGGPGSLFRADPLYSSSPSESPRLTNSLVNSFLASSGGGAGTGGGGGGGSNECKMVDLHGVKVASFLVEGQELICLPQVFDLFLKHLVGGLHTVYTKLKRLDISPVVCTVEQVRILRGLGAIQPGVNRCKLITRKDFETLYNDCTNASSRPGRPPKRSLGVAIQENARLLPHGVPGLLSPGLISPTDLRTLFFPDETQIKFAKLKTLQIQGLTAAAMAEAMKLQKMKLMAMNSLHGSGSQNGTESENEELNSNAGIELPFMMMPHPLLPVSLPPASVAMAMNQMNHLNTIANMAAAAQMHSPLSRAGASVIKERIQDSPSPAPSLEDSQRPGSHASSHQSSSVSSSPSQLDNTPDRIAMLTNTREGELIDQDTGTSLKKLQKEKEEVQIAIPIMKPTLDKVQLAGQTLPPGFPAPFLFADGLSSVETLLTNIQGLLKVAVDNARVQEKQIQQEKKELKMELCRERELRESLERQLTAELQSRATIQKRLKKEKKAKRKLQEALEFESKRREQVEQALKQATSGDGLRMLNEAGIPDMEIEHNGTQHDSAAMQENRTYVKPTIMY
ncbi:dachshund homolog 2 isoform X5 [Trachemys scripta elegans]|uniref:dachshund homolog 2 isoform X9 n=1 Tax=Chrysemys picta bellii TaxID=8478 RepID=UPI000CE64475|nr:dachshund homolog 2 isoform X8 [Chrysemys picta bellii]XP_034637134.1 dachshund homolog 2 isoform X5 [Trachemys scripta elegans]XP_053894751.1 dachshund homolog 2 isoform X5 [Malaclemys terrapin pileata]